MAHVTEQQVRELILEVYIGRTIVSLVAHGQEGDHWWEATLDSTETVRVSALVVDGGNERPIFIPKIEL